MQRFFEDGSHFAGFIFVVLFIYFPTTSFAQYNTLPVGDGLWVQGSWVGPGYPFMGWSTTISGASDTLINGIPYRSIGQGGNGFVRDDMLGHVYWILDETSEEGILYNFDVSLGDTIFPATQISLSEPLIVLQVDSVMINGYVRKRIVVALLWEPSYQNEWIQGIGSKHGLFNLCQGPSVSGSSWLACMSEDGIAQYGGNVGQPYNCLVHIGLNESNKEDEVLTASPNPSVEQFTFNVDQPKHIVVYDSFGREVLQTFGTSVDLSDEPEGMYVALLPSSNSLRQAQHSAGNYAQVVRLIVSR